MEQLQKIVNTDFLGPHVIRTNFEDDGFEIGQPRDNLWGQIHQGLGGNIGMPVDPMVLKLFAATKMDFPYAFERQFRDSIQYSLAAVAGVSPQVVQVQENTAVRCLRRPTKKSPSDISPASGRR